jgi:hypothetical protein
MCIRIRNTEKNSLKLVTNEKWRGGGQILCSQARIEVIDVLLSLKFAAILKTCVSVSAPLQRIEQATFNRIGVYHSQWSLPLNIELYEVARPLLFCKLQEQTMILKLYDNLIEFS